MKITEKSLKLKKFIYPFTHTLLKSVVDFDIDTYYNLVNSSSDVIKNNNQFQSTKKPLIFVVNHSNVHDFPVVNMILKKHCIVLSDINNREGINGRIIDLNGAIYFDRTNKEQRKIAFKSLKDVLNLGYNVLLFPEGTWNLSDNLPILPFSWGIIDVAKETNTNIVPIILEYRDMDNTFKHCYANIGKEFDVKSFNDKKEAYHSLRDYMATLRYNLWDLFLVEKRENNTKEMFDKYNDFLLSEYPRMNYEEEKKVIFHDYDTEEDVFKYIKK